VKTAISIPDELARRVDDAARRAGLSRSGFYQQAAELYANQLAGADITARMNAALASGANPPDEDWAQASRAHLAAATDGDDW
jgi:metal-responsive CopG/Arc/MetJ family transcriptional regulator